MAVGTGAISLTEVIAEVSGASGSLQSCVDNYDPNAMDNTYWTSRPAAPVSLAEFRGYNEVAITPTMTLNPQFLPNLGASAGSFTMSVTSNTTWQINAGLANWITITGASGSGNDSTITINYTANTTGSQRSTNIFASTTSGSPTAQDTTSVTQLSGFE